MPVPDNLVIIPTYNERENIRKIIERVLQLSVPFHVLVVDDGSPDGTANVVRDMQLSARERLHLLERPGKLGLGTAYIEGFHWGLDRGYNYLYEMDADFSHPPEKLITLFEVMRDDVCDVAIGSRYVRGGKVKNWPFGRKVLSYGASIYVRLITWMPVKDPTAGFVGYKATVLRHMALDKIKFVGYAFQIEMKYNVYKLGFKMREIPITFVDRVAGISKLSSNIIHEAIFGVWAMRLQTVQRRQPA